MPRWCPHASALPPNPPAAPAIEADRRPNTGPRPLSTVTLVIERDEDGRLHGTIEAQDLGSTRSHFTGVIELVARIEEVLDRARWAADRPGPNRSDEP